MSRPTYSTAVREAERLRGELVEETPGRASREELSRWADDPVGWDRAAGREPTDYQRAVMESVATNRRTAWRGCHNCGKDFTIGSLAVWGAYARGMLVLVVSATEQQVIKQTMREVRAAWRAARKAHGIGGELYQGSVRVGGEDRIIALTGSANIDALTGWHDARSGVMMLISEGQGERLEEAVYDASEGNVATSKGRILAAGNPVRPHGRFYEIHQRSSWERFKTSAFDTPNVKAGEVVRPGFPAPDFPQDKQREYGKDSVWYRGRVLAEFPSSTSDSAFRMGWVESAMQAHTKAKDGEALDFHAKDAPWTLGVDLAASEDGDETVVAIRRGPVVYDLRAWREPNTKESAHRVVAIWEELNEDGRAHVGAVVVDAVAVGKTFYDHLAETYITRPQPAGADRFGRPRTRSTKVEPFDARKKARDPEGFHNLRSQAFWTLRELLEDQELLLPEDAALKEELTRMPYRIDGQGRTWFKKDDLKARIGRSPDRADAVAISLYPELEQPGKSEVWFR